MESGIAVHPLASTEPRSPLERAGVALETRDGGVVEDLDVPTDSAAAKGGENHAWSVPESDSPDKPDTPPSRLSLDQLRAEIDAAVGSLPTILRVCTVDALTERVAPVFQDADHARCVKKPKNQSEWRERDEETRRGDATSSPRRWEALRAALAVSPSRRARRTSRRSTRLPRRWNGASEPRTRPRPWTRMRRLRSPRLSASASRRAAPAAACSPRRRCGGTRRLSARASPPRWASAASRRGCGTSRARSGS